MHRTTYDIITVGGGLGGSALARAMAENGADVLVLESQLEFKDRVRGESVLPWGVAEAKKLGIYDGLMASCGHELPWWDMYLGPVRVLHRDLVASTQPGVPAISFYHPAMQEVLMQSAESAGAKVRRGARVVGLSLDGTPTVQVRVDGVDMKVQARLVVGADGRDSRVRAWAGFQARRDPDQNLIAGLLFDDMPAPEDANHLWLNPSIGHASFVFPQGNGRVRAYVIYPAETGVRLSGTGDIPLFIEYAVKIGAPGAFYSDARPAGPLATFDGAASIVDYPYRRGVALIGDAAGHSDPTFGQGTSTTLRDVRVLRDLLLQLEDWDEAGNAYAEEHRRYFNVTNTIETWWTEVLFKTGPEADALRSRVLPLWQQDPTRQTDVIFSGPDLEITESIRRRLFGEE